MNSSEMISQKVKLPGHRPGLPGHAVASRMGAKVISFHIVPLNPAHRAELAGHVPVKIRWQSKKLQMQGAQILRNEAYLEYVSMMKEAAQRSPSALLRAVSMSNGSWTFYEAIKS